MSTTYQHLPLIEAPPIVPEPPVAGYICESRAAVQQFLEAAPALIPLLLEAYPVIQSYFPQAAVHLEVVDDPEAIGITELVAAINPPAAPDEAVEILLRFADGWWRDAAARAQGK